MFDVERVRSSKVAQQLQSIGAIINLLQHLVGSHLLIAELIVFTERISIICQNNPDIVSSFKYRLPPVLVYRSFVFGITCFDFLLERASPSNMIMWLVERELDMWHSQVPLLWFVSIKVCVMIHVTFGR